MQEVSAKELKMTKDMCRLPILCMQQDHTTMNEIL